jgi:hypothetical protein
LRQLTAESVAAQILRQMDHQNLKSVIYFCKAVCAS